MSYKVEITAATTAELAGKLLALAAQMANDHPHTDPVMPEVKAADTAARQARKTKKAEEVAAEPAGEPVTAAAETASSQSAIATAQPETSERPATLTNNDGSAESSASEAPGSKALDFDKDVAPAVLNAVHVKGKPWVQEILAQFGVERASQVPDERLGELVAALQDGEA